MLDFLRNPAKSATEKRGERLNAYMDDALSAKERRQFEQELAHDPHLQAELTELQQVRAGLRQMPRLRVPQNFTLDPAAYGRPVPDRVMQWYPALRAVTAVVAIAFAFVLVAQLFLSSGNFLSTLESDSAAAPALKSVLEDTDTVGGASEVALERASEEVVEEEMVAESAPPMAELPAEAQAIDASDEAMEEAEAAADIPFPTRQETAPAAPSEGVGEAEGELNQFAPALEATASPTVAPTATPRPTATLAPTPPPPPIEPAPALPAHDTRERGEPAPSISALLLAAIILGMTLVILVITVLFLRRRL